MYCSRVVGTFCVAIPMVLNGAIGAKLHVPFSVITSTFSQWNQLFACRILAATYALLPGLRGHKISCPWIAISILHKISRFVSGHLDLHNINAPVPWASSPFPRSDAGSLILTSKQRAPLATTSDTSVLYHVLFWPCSGLESKVQMVGTGIFPPYTYLVEICHTSRHSTSYSNNACWANARCAMYNDHASRLGTELQ